jgi:hypothetical protein
MGFPLTNSTSTIKFNTNNQVSIKY